MTSSQERDALLALISTLSVVFVVLFFSLVYFSVLREDVAQREAAVDAELQNLKLHPVAGTSGSVAGYETEQPGSDYEGD